MGASQRRKGNVGRAEFSRILQERDWRVSITSAGYACEDMLGTDPSGKAYAIEVKFHKQIDLGAFLKQAKQQAKARDLPWMLAARLQGFGGLWLVFREDQEPALWQAKT